MILDHIARARRMGLPYLYLGYWVEGSKKMAYKARFTPQERLLAPGWVRSSDPGAGRPPVRRPSRLATSSGVSFRERPASRPPT